MKFEMKMIIATFVFFMSVLIVGIVVKNNHKYTAITCNTTQTTLMAQVNICLPQGTQVFLGEEADIKLSVEYGYASSVKGAWVPSKKVLLVRDVESSTYWHEMFHATVGNVETMGAVKNISDQIDATGYTDRIRDYLVEHKVSNKGYFLDFHEVTARIFEGCMVRNHGVTMNMSWNNAEEFMHMYPTEDEMKNGACAAVEELLLYANAERN